MAEEDFRVIKHINAVYIAKANIPSTAANSIHVMKISEAFAEICDRFRLIVPQSENYKENVDKIFEIYGVKEFQVETVKITKTGLRNRLGFPIKSLWKARTAQCVITRDPIVAFLSVIFHKQTVLDLHGDLRHLCGRAYRMIRWKGFRDSKYLHLVVITKGLADFYDEKYGVPKERMTVLPDGYTNSKYLITDNRRVLEGKEINIGYCGGFVQGKGLNVICQVAQNDLENHYNLYGGTKEEAEKETQTEFSDNVTFGGYVPNAKIPGILNEQDILLLPNQKQQICKNEDIGMVTSPLKMFEYMASGRVIIASDIPVLREILDDSNCYFADPDDIVSWIRVIEYIGVNRDEAVAKAEKAQQDVKQYTWRKRAEKMTLLAGAEI